jgi:predicted DNA binding CopG/RHH family protein
MEDTRVSIRLSEHEHKKLKIIAIECGTNIQEMLHEYILKIIEDGKYEK